jgi:hypothetical protein
MNNFDLDILDKYYLIQKIELEMVELLDKKRGKNDDKIDVQFDILAKLLYLLKTYRINNKENNIFVFETNNIGEISDGSHTFNDLYMHRTMLFAVICNTYKEKAWKSWKHNSKEEFPMYEDYFIVGVETPEGQYSYHCHKDWWDKFEVPELEEAPEYDGHMPEDVERLLSLIKKEDE